MPLFESAESARLERNWIKNPIEAGKQQIQLGLQEALQSFKRYLQIKRVMSRWVDKRAEISSMTKILRNICCCNFRTSKNRCKQYSSTELITG